MTQILLTSFSKPPTIVLAGYLKNTPPPKLPQVQEVPPAPELQQSSEEPQHGRMIQGL